ncbi:hypothetical protein BDAP_001247 [Binucleata daphniae]
MSLEPLKHVYYTKKLYKSFILPLNIIELHLILSNSNHTLKQNSHFLYSLCIIYSKQIKYLLEETIEFYNKLSVKPVKKKRRNINLQLLSDLKLDFDSSIHNCFEESCKEYIRNMSNVNNTQRIDDNEDIQINNETHVNFDNIDTNIDVNNSVSINTNIGDNFSNFLINELPQIKKRRIIDNVTEFDSDDTKMFMRISKSSKKEEKPNLYSNFCVPHDIKRYFEGIKPISIETGRNNNDNDIDKTNNSDAFDNHDISVEVGRIENESYYEPYLSSESVENVRIEDLPAKFILNAEIQKMSKREKATLFLQLLKGCSENVITAKQDIPFGNIYCEIQIN